MKKTKYPSRFSPEKLVSASQYITEYICEKKAKISKKELPIKFWELPEWLKYYKFQIVLANRLLKTYSEDAIIAALKDKDAYRVYSLNSPVLIKLIKKHQDICETKRQNEEKADVKYNITKGENFVSNNNAKSIITKLRDLDG